MAAKKTKSEPLTLAVLRLGEQIEVKKTPSLAAAMIAKASRGPVTTPDPSAEMLAELRTICEYNDGAAWKSKVTALATLEMLNAAGWPGSQHALNNLCRRALGRKSFGQP